MRIGLIGAGEMGSGIGGLLAAGGATVVTTLAGRSAASAARIGATGVAVLDDLAAVARTSNIVLSIVPPDRAVSVAEAFVVALGKARPAPIFVDCNAIAPATVERIARIVHAGEMRFVDAGIVGAAPRKDFDGPTVYASGPDAAAFATLTAYGLQVRVLEGPLGMASSLKMCYAGISKGFTAIGAAMFAAADRAGVGEALKAEFEESQPELNVWLTRQIPTMYPKAYRWVGEMREIATFGANEPGVPVIYEGFAQAYDAIAERMKTKGHA